MPPRQVRVQFEGSIAQLFTFRNIKYEDGTLGQRCEKPGCKHPDIKVTGDHHARQHCQKHHRPTAAITAQHRLDSLGNKGTAISNNFIALCKVKGRDDRAKTIARTEELDNARAKGIPPPPLITSEQQRTVVVRANSDALPMELDTAQLYSTPQEKIQWLLDENARLNTELDISCRPLLACSGVRLDIEDPIFDNYPFQLHSLRVLEITWQTPDENGTVHSKACTVWSEYQICEPCTELTVNSAFIQLQTRSKTPDLHLSTINDKYLTLNQLNKRLEARRQISNQVRLKLHISNSLLKRYMRHNTEYDRILRTISENKIKRLPNFLGRLLHEEKKPSAILKLVVKAVHSTGYSRKDPYTDDEVDKSMALLILGGKRAVKLQQMTEGGPSKRFLELRNSREKKGFIACSGRLNDVSLLYNVKNFVNSIEPPPEKHAWHLLMDNVNVDERLRYATTGGKQLGGVKGIARESQFNGSLVILNANDFEYIRQSFVDGKLVLAKEMTVVVAIRNSPVPIIVPLYASGTSKQKGSNAADAQREMLRDSIRVWDKFAAESFGDIISVFLRPRFDKREDHGVLSTTDE